MPSRLLRLPSPAMVVATGALIMGLGGSSYAALRHAGDEAARPVAHAAKLTAAERRAVKRLIARYIRAHPAPPGATGPTGPAGPPGPPGAAGRDGAPATKLFARVENDGTTASASVASGVTSVTRQDRGFVVIEFDRDVSACAVVATAWAGNGGASLAHASVTTSPRYAPTRVAVATRYGSDGSFIDTDFQIAALCG